MKRLLYCAYAMAAIVWICPEEVGAANDVGSRAPQGTEVFTIASPSVVTIRARSDSGTVIQGSGVVFGREPLMGGWVATNCHVVSRAAQLAVRYGKRWHTAALLAADEELDLCLLLSEELPAAAAKVRTTPPLTVGEPVYAIGSPRGLDLSISNGIVSQVRAHRSTYQLIQTTAPISKGSSGGGLFDSAGRLVGITTFYLNESQNLNFAIPAAAIQDTLHSALTISNMLTLSRDSSKQFASVLDQAVPGWKQDLESKEFKRWLGLARDHRGQRVTGGVHGLSFIALPPDNWQPAIDLFRDYRASPFYVSDVSKQHSAESPESRTAARSPWELVGRWNDLTIYGDRRRIRKVDQRLLIWSLTDYPVPREIAGKNYLSAIRVLEVECDSIRSATRQVTYFSGQMGSGQVIINFAPTTEDRTFSFSFAIPGTPSDRIVAWACDQ